MRAGPLRRRRSQSRRALHRIRGLFFCACLWQLVGCAPEVASPRAVGGRLDLRGWDFAGAGDVVLQGGWDICWGQLVEPGQACPSTWKTTPVPGLWSEPDAESPFGGHGVATYRIRIALPPGSGRLALEAGGPLTSYRLFIDGAFAGGVGTVARSADEAVMDVRNRVYDVAPDTGELELLVQVANFGFRGGGLRRLWHLGRPDSIQAEMGRAILREGMVFAVGVLVGLSYLALFLLGRSEQARGYFGLAALVLGLRAIPASISDFGALVMPWPKFEMLTRLEYLGTAIALFAGAGYALTKVPGVAPPRTLKGIQLASLAFGAIVLFAPFQVALATLWIQYVLPVIVLGVLVASYGAAWVRGVPGVRVTVVAGGVYLIAVGHDILRTEESSFGLDIELYPYAMVLWILAEGYDLLRRFYATFIRVESLSEALSDANFELQETESAIMRFVPFDFLRTLGKQSIRDVDVGDRVRSEVSVLHCGFHARAGATPPTSLEEGFDALTDLVSRAEPIVQRRGGFVNEFRGDGFQAFFPGSAIDAVTAALEIFDVIDALRAAPGPTGQVAIDVAIGVDTGSVLLGTVGGGDQVLRGIVGAAVDGARQVEVSAHRRAGRVWISSTTRSALGDLRDVDIERVRAAGMAGTAASELFEVRPRRAASVGSGS